MAIAGGAATVNEYLALDAIDELRLHIAPVVLGQGERLFEGVGNFDLQQSPVRGTDLVTHVTYRVVRSGDIPVRRSGRPTESATCEAGRPPP